MNARYFLISAILGTLYLSDGPSFSAAITGTNKTCRFKFSVSRDAGSQMYPIDVFAAYKNHNGDTVTS